MLYDFMKEYSRLKDNSIQINESLRQSGSSR
jgi:hypothetical protein